MSFVVRRGEIYSARLVIPKKLRPIIGRSEFKKSLGTASLKEAELLAAPLILQWKKLIEEAAQDGVMARAKALKRAFDEGGQGSDYDEFIKGVIIEGELEDVVLGGRDFHEVEDAHLRKTAKTFYGIASGQIVTLEGYVAGWVASLAHLRQKTVDQMQRDVIVFHKEETAHIPDKKLVSDWVRRSALEDVGVKSLKRRLSALNSFWTYLLSIQVVSDPSPFSGHAIHKTGGGRSIVRRGFSNAECLELMKAAAASRDGALSDLIQLALYTGARIEELCSLRVEDVVVEESHRALRVRQAKTKAGVRYVPLHPSIVSVVDRLIDESRDGYLIPSSAKNQYGQRSPSLSKRFARLKKELGFGPELVFHSLRKTVTTKLERAGVMEGVAADIVGHEKQTMTYGLYSGGTSMAQKMEAISQITYR